MATDTRTDPAILYSPRDMAWTARDAQLRTFPFRQLACLYADYYDERPRRDDTANVVIDAILCSEESAGCIHDDRAPMTEQTTSLRPSRAPMTDEQKAANREGSMTTREIRLILASTEAQAFTVRAYDYTAMDWKTRIYRRDEIAFGRDAWGTSGHTCVYLAGLCKRYTDIESFMPVGVV